MPGGAAFKAIRQPDQRLSPGVQEKRRRAAELEIVKQARAESRKQVQALEQMKQYARAAFLTNGVATEEDFELCWPMLRDEILRLQASKMK